MKRNSLKGRFARVGSRHQAGVGLIEVLVAVLVLSIGFLGVAALQARSLSTNNSAMVRSMATIASYSILDAMRADISGARNNAYNKTIKGNACGTAGSTLASQQLYQWCAAELQPIGQGAATTVGTIQCSAAAGTTTALCTVTIQFDDSRAGDAGTSSQKLVTQAML
ncbi:type IV pilus modification protein PilV [Dyella sp.]|uniref:type IV pilus modification protein PilV n=1 Tax=Dyella sp. TaxID=1869338 RepID=UPI002D7656DB|nr:type IV pilus modification protein PilV [Dyella sp.]HET7329537.1 type IV pilus modification protein PilV [Dyella sp.]